MDLEWDRCKRTPWRVSTVREWEMRMRVTRVGGWKAREMYPQEALAAVAMVGEVEGGWLLWRQGC